MTRPFNRFTEGARRALSLAEDEAKRLDHPVLPGHLLVGLALEREGIAARVLNSYEMKVLGDSSANSSPLDTPAVLRVELELYAVRDDWRSMRKLQLRTNNPLFLGSPPFLQSDVVRDAAARARKLGETHVGTEHLLLGIVRQGEREVLSSKTYYNYRREVPRCHLEGFIQLVFAKHAISLTDLRERVLVAIEETEPVNEAVQTRERIPAGMRFKVLQRDSHACQYCGRPAGVGVVLHVDHVVPIALGGLTTMDNLVTACADCNLGKGAR